MYGTKVELRQRGKQRGSRENMQVHWSRHAGGVEGNQEWKKVTRIRVVMVVTTRTCVGEGKR